MLTRLQAIFFLLMIMDLVGRSTTDDVNRSFFNFRKTTLDNFNDARRLLAGGDFKKLYNILKLFLKKEWFNGDILGPASNMYQLKWSKKLEQIGYEYMKEDASKRASDPLATIEYKDHIGFYWQGNIFGLLNTITNGLLPEGVIKDKLKNYLEMLEGIVIFIWLSIKAPKTLPLKEGDSFGAAEALFGERYELGCFTELVYSVCFVKRLPYREHMFKVGVPCTSCPTHCEYWKESDGTITEGELCVPPKEEQLNYVPSNITLTDVAPTYSLILNVVLVLTFETCLL